MQYESLPRDITSIRLLELLPARKGDDHVSCRLITVALDTNKTYTALSYTWNHALDSEIIYVNDRITRIGTNLASAFRHMRTAAFRAPSPISPLIWADGVCINQNDEEEKSHQVQLMGAIYSKASTVVSWLGADNNGEMTSAIMAMKSVQHVAESVPDWLEDLNWMHDYPSFLEFDCDLASVYNQVWGSLRSFFSAPYWRRVWVLQEMVLAQSLWVMVGQHILDYKSVINYVQLIRQFSPESRLGEKVLPSELLYLLRCSEWIPTAPHMIVDEFREYSRICKHMNNEEKFEAIFSTLEYQATNPKDKIFALQGLLGNFINPNYGKSTLEVYSNLVSKYIADVGDLYLLSFSGAALRPPDTLEPYLPSWVPNWQAISRMDSWQAFPARAFHSDHGMDALCSFSARVLDQRCLRVNACICDTTSEAEPIFVTNSANIVRLYQKFIEKRRIIENRTKVTYLQAILRAILTENFPEHQLSGYESDSFPMQRLLLATVYFLEGLLSSPPIFDTLQSSIEKLGIGFKNHVTTFLQTAFPDETIHDCWKFEKAVVWSIISQGHLLRPYLTRSSKERHHLFYTYAGYIGSSLDGIQAGDMIGVIQGSSCPVLLRKEGTQYIYLGTCYVLGLMNGEAALMVKQGSLAIETVDIV